MIKIHSIKVYGLLDAIKSTSFSYKGEIPEIKDIELTDRMINVCRTLGSKQGIMGEDKFLRFINVQFVVEASKYWWAECDTYHFIERQSQGTLHCDKRFNYESIKDPNIDPIIWNRFIDIMNEYVNNPTLENRMKFRANLPEGFAMTSALYTNYATMKTIYKQRHNHPLPEWHTFCDFITQLPLSVVLGLVPKDKYPDNFKSLDDIKNYYEIKFNAK